ncbi:MAG: non-ribosomal peptide synthetase, partial [Niastella sp.]|uniref:non-ribosomal peptide synthetase n=1 Tax=Niastella sp. TaxID=1869183 RepID=UPI003899DDC7
KGLSHFIEWEIGTFHIDSSHRFSQFVNPGFDAFMRDIFVPLCSGGTICIPEEDNLSTAPKISAWIDRQRINLIHCVPSFFKLFGKGDLKEEQYPALQYVLLAGEKILPYELQEWHQAFGERIRLVNLYGATETTLVKGYRFIESDITGNAIPVRAMPGAQFLIADKEMHISPRGAEGEIYIRTPYRTAGYLDAAATKRSFIVNPYSNNNDDLLYRTGDLGRASENGEIEITGRADQQVKIRGIRIEPDDIRENILRYPEVQDVIVQVKTDKEGEPFICAYIVPGSPLSQDALRDFLQARLPSNMIPAYLIPMAAFPLLENGKIDRKALPEPDARSTAGYIAPVNATEDKLVEIWSEVLKIDKEGISVTKSFIELGGHSLKILLLINKISQHFHVSIPLKVIFDKKNIQNLADYLITVTQAACELTDSMGSKEISL